MSLTTDLTRTGLGYIFTVADSSDPSTELLRFEVGSIVKTQWGIKARITVRSKIATARTVPSRSGYVTTEGVSLLDGRSRQSFADRLGQLIPAPAGGATIDWGVLVEEMVVGVMDAEHRQPVVVNLSTVTGSHGTPHLYPYLLPERKATILYGAGGTGKSAFAATLACAVETGAHLFGVQCSRRRTLYLDWETDEGDVANRIAYASRGLGLTKTAPVSYMALELPLEMEMSHIAATVAEGGYGFVILDSVGMASSYGRDGSDPASEAIQFFRALRILDTTVLCIDHISGEDQRRGRQGAAKPYGSIFKWNTARNAFELVEAGEGKLLLRHRKANLGPKMPSGEMMMSVEWDDVTEMIRYRRVDNMTPRVELNARIRTVLESGPATYRTMLEVLNSDTEYEFIGEATLRIATRTLIADGEVNVDGQGVLRLPSHQEEDPAPDPTAPGQLELPDEDQA